MPGMMADERRERRAVRAACARCYKEYAAALFRVSSCPSGTDAQAARRLLEAAAGRLAKALKRLDALEGLTGKETRR